MSLNVVTKVEPEYVCLTVDGVFEFSEMLRFIVLAKTESDKAAKKKVLMDCRQMEGSLTEADRFQGGQEFARVFGPRLKGALVLPVGQVTSLGELAAVNRGAVLKVTESMDDAINWLAA